MVWAHGRGSRTRRRFKEAMPLTISGRERSAAMLAATGLLVSRPLLAEPHFFGETRACGGVVRRHHGIIPAKTPLLAILLWCEVVMGAQVSLERLEFLSVFEAG
jgi:hypothetical protein